MESLGSVLTKLAASKYPTLPDASLCQECQGIHWDCPGIPEGIPDDVKQQAACRCKQRRAKAAARREQEADLPTWKAVKSFETFNVLPKGTRDMYDAGMRLARGDGPMTLLLTGTVGSGKTHIAQAVGLAYLTQGYTVRFEKVSRMLVNLRSTQSYESEDSLQAWLRWYESRELLILDDLAVKERVETAWARDVLLTIIDYRLEHQKPLVITTNCDKEEMAMALGDRMASRLFSMNPDLNMVEVVAVGAADYRA